MIAEYNCSAQSDACLLSLAVCSPVQCSEDPVSSRQYASLVFVNNHHQVTVTPNCHQDEYNNSSVSLQPEIDDETWNAQIIKHTKRVLLALPYLDCNSEEVAACLDQIQRDICVLLGDEDTHDYDIPCGEDHA